MISVSSAYKNACLSSTRKSYLMAKYDNFDEEAKSKVSSLIGSHKAFSKLNDIINNIRTTRNNYISCEPNRCKLDGTFCFVKDKTTTNVNENIAYWSSEMSNASKTFTTNPEITISFSEEIDFSDLTLTFQEVCDSFDVTYYLSGSQIAIRKVTDNNNLIVSTSGTIVNSKFDEIKITFKKTKEAYRYIKLLEFDIGIERKFTSEEIMDLSIIDELSIDSSELSANSLELVIRDYDGDYNILNPNNKLQSIEEKRRITIFYYLYVDGVYQELPLGTFLIKKFDNQKERLIISAYDDTYFMNDIYYGSPFYNNALVSDILNNLFAYFNYNNYTIDSNILGDRLTGYIPPVEFREALRLICEANRCVATKNRYGQIRIFRPSTTNFSKIFRRREFFKENNTKNMFNNKINIVEYNYTNEVYDMDLYNAILKQGEHWIIFNSPVRGASIDKAEVNNDYSIDYFSATSCKVTVTSSSTQVKLIGYRYQMVSSVKRIPNSLDFDNDYSIPKVDNHLITINNSVFVADWKLNRNEIKYDFNTFFAPYIEVGDACIYETKFDEKKAFIPTKIEFTKSIQQSIEGE